MRIFLIFISILLSVSTLSCSRYRKGIRVKKHKKPIESISIGNVDNRQTKLDITQIQPEKMFFILNHNKTRRKVEPICRGINGCLNVCEHFNNQDAKKCTNLSVNQVLHFWVHKIAKYDWSLAQKDLQFIATNKEVATFLQKSDKNHRILKSLFQLGTYAKCPIRLNLGIQYAPFTTLYLKPSNTPAKSDQSDTADTSSANTAQAENMQNNDVASSSDTTSTNSDKTNEVGTAIVSLADNANSNASKTTDTSHEHKVDANAPDHANAPANVKQDEHPHVVWSNKETKRKIIDSAVTSFDFPIFFSFIKKCFGKNPNRTFTDIAVEMENKPAFDIAHGILSQACDKNSECIRLAYCDIDSHLVWKQVPDEYKTTGCKYEHFIEPIPKGSVDSNKTPIQTEVEPAT